MISLKEYLSGGETTISNLLLQNYTKLGLTTNEFMLWLQLYASHQAGEDFPDLTIIAQIWEYDRKNLCGFEYAC